MNVLWGTQPTTEGMQERVDSFLHSLGPHPALLQAGEVRDQIEELETGDEIDAELARLKESVSANGGSEPA